MTDGTKRKGGMTTELRTLHEDGDDRTDGVDADAHAAPVVDAESDGDVTDAPEAEEVVRRGSRMRVQSVERAAQVLRELLDADAPLTTMEVAAKTGLNRTVVHRLLRTMQDTYMVVETASGRFHLGPAMLLYGNSYKEWLPVRQQALPHLADLGRRVVGDRPWVVALAVPIGTEMVIVERTWNASAPLDTILGVGMKMPMARSGHGRAFLSSLSDDEAAELLGEELPELLRTRLAEARAAGHVAIASNERRPGVGAIAAAIFGRDRQVVGSIAISGLDMEPELEGHVTEITHELRSAADAISHALSLRAD